MDPVDPAALAAEMSQLIQRTPGVLAAYALTRPIVLLLARGEPVGIDELATTAGVPAERLADFLHSSPFAEWTDDGRLQGFGLTLRPTPHSLRAGDRTLYVWTAADAFVSAVLLRQPVRISSSCRVTGVPIHVEVASSRVTRTEPATAVVTTLARPGTRQRLRWLDVSRQLFFRSPPVAAAWLEQTPGYVVLDMHQALDYARHLVAALPG